MDTKHGKISHEVFGKLYFASALCKVMPLKWGIPYTFKEFATMQQYT
jgi:hypothetical protein